MGLNKSKGQMYEWVTHTWNAIKGECPHDCTYCYMKRWCNLNPVRLDESELRTDLGEDNFIFVGSSCDMFAEGIKMGWQLDTITHCTMYPKNHYLFQTKNPINLSMLDSFDLNYSVCTTIETNRHYKHIMKCCPEPVDRAIEFSRLKCGSKYVTIEPIMDFDIVQMVDLIYRINPIQVNIGADSGNNNLPEPPVKKIKELIQELTLTTIVKKKKNLKRLYNDK